MSWGRDFKEDRDQDLVGACLEKLRETCRGRDNLLPRSAPRLAAHATVGEVCGVMREELGEYVEARAPAVRAAPREVADAQPQSHGCGVAAPAAHDSTGRRATIANVPTISSFYGILIRMYFGDHPPPHFHVRYGEHKARFAIVSGHLIDGELPARAQRLVREWVSLHREELSDNWRRCEQRVPLQPVEPLP